MSAPPYFEAIVKVNPTDDPARRVRDITEGIGYACALLMDEYGIDPDDIVVMLERVADDVQDEAASRAENSHSRPAEAGGES